jgi:hypothetical protein
MVREMAFDALEELPGMLAVAPQAKAEARQSFYVDAQGAQHAGQMAREASLLRGEAAARQPRLDGSIVRRAKRRTWLYFAA